MQWEIQWAAPNEAEINHLVAVCCWKDEVQLPPSVLINTRGPGCSTTAPGYVVILFNSLVQKLAPVLTGLWSLSVSPATGQGEWEVMGRVRDLTLSLSARCYIKIWVLRTSNGIQQMRSSVSRRAVSCASPHTSTGVGVRSHAGWEEESGTTTSVCSFTAKWRACSFPSLFPPPPSGSWLIPHSIAMVLCTSSSPLSLPCTKRK